MGDLESDSKAPPVPSLLTPDSIWRFQNFDFRNRDKPASAETLAQL